MLQNFFALKGRDNLDRDDNQVTKIPAYHSKRSAEHTQSHLSLIGEDQVDYAKDVSFWQTVFKCM